MKISFKQSALLVISSVAAGLSSTAMAEKPVVEGNVAFVSDYLFRGVSQTDNGPAIQGGLDLTTGSGFYLGAWGSNIEFGEGSMELDIYGGWSGQITDHLSADAGVIHYEYPQGDTETDELSYQELYASISYSGLGLGIHWSPDYFGTDVDQYQYYYLSYDLDLPMSWSAGASLGINQFENAEEMSRFLGIAGDEGDNYQDWKAYASYAFTPEMAVTLAYIDTDIPRNQCDELCNGQWTASIERSF